MSMKKECSVKTAVLESFWFFLFTHCSSEWNQRSKGASIKHITKNKFRLTLTGCCYQKNKKTLSSVQVNKLKGKLIRMSQRTQCRSHFKNRKFLSKKIKCFKDIEYF